MEKLEELGSLKDQVKAVRLQDELGKQNFHEDMKKPFEPMTDIVKDVSNDITDFITETLIKNYKAISDLNEKVFEVMNIKGITAPFSASSLVNLLKPENNSQFKLIKISNSFRMNDFFMNTNISSRKVSRSDGGWGGGGGRSYVLR